MEYQRQELRERIEKALATVRPFLQNDGGDVTLDSISDDLVVHVQLHGTCVSCPLSELTMRHGIVESIKQNAPEVREVKAVRVRG